MIRTILESEYCNAYAHGLTISGQCKCVLPCTDPMCVCENCRKSRDKIMFEVPKSNVSVSQVETRTIQEMLHDSLNRVSKENQRLHDEIKKLKKQTEEHQKDLIKKDLLHIFEVRSLDCYLDSEYLDYAIEDITKYILERLK